VGLRKEFWTGVATRRELDLRYLAGPLKKKGQRIRRGEGGEKRAGQMERNLGWKRGEKRREEEKGWRVCVC
jgi:hypothetical protein